MAYVYHEIQVRNDIFETIPLNLKRAIVRKCKECVGWSYSEVKSCTTEDCALHPFRLMISSASCINFKWIPQGLMHSKLYKKYGRGTAIRCHCLECVQGDSEMISVCGSTNCSLWPFRHGSSWTRLYPDKVYRGDCPGSTKNAGNVSVDDKIQAISSVAIG